MKYDKVANFTRLKKMLPLNTISNIISITQTVAHMLDIEKRHAIHMIFTLYSYFL